MRKFILKGISFLLVLWSGMVGVMFFSQRDMLYFPQQISEQDRAFLKSFADPVELHTEDGLTLTAWFRPPQEKGVPILVAFHGNAGHPVWLGSKLKDFMDGKVGLFLVEYRGYDGNSGSPSEDGLYLDGRAALDWLKSNGNPPFVLYGESIGSGVATELALRPENQKNLKALILEVPFDSLLNVAKHHYPFVPFLDFLMLDQFRNDEKIGKVHVPLLVLLADRDQVVPHELGLRLYDLANEPKELEIFPGADHGTVFENGGWNKVSEFLTGIFQ